MELPNDDPFLHHSGEPEQEALYETLGGLLQRMVMRQFQVSPEDAQSLVRETFIVFSEMNVARSEAQEWLTGAVCSSAKAYMQRRGLVAPEDVTEREREIRRELAHRDALAMLPSQDREALRLRFEERKTYPEIAAELDVSVEAAQRIVARAAAKLRGRIRG